MSIRFSALTGVVYGKGVYGVIDSEIEFKDLDHQQYQVSKQQAIRELLTRCL